MTTPEMVDVVAAPWAKAETAHAKLRHATNEASLHLMRILLLIRQNPNKTAGGNPEGPVLDLGMG
jgi:hypothetical protein